MTRTNFIGILGLMAALTGCLGALEKLPDAVEAISEDSDATAREIFDSRIQGLYQRARCVSCHDVQTPYITSFSEDEAYANSLALLNLSSPTQSALYEKAIDGHCLATCQILSSSEWADALGDWGDAEAAEAGAL